MVTTVEASRAQIASERQADYERWQQEQLANPRLTPLALLEHDIRHFGYVTEQGWARFDNEKYSRSAERITNLHHERIDYYVFDPETNDIIITETDGITPRYTMRDVYQNGLDRSRAFTAEHGPRFAFQERRDELFMQTYEQVEAMMRGETDYDTITMASTLPFELVHTDPDALKQKFYDLEYGKQFEYVFQRIPLDNGRFILGLGASTLYAPQVDLQIGTMHGRAGLAAVQQRHGVSVPYAMVSSHEQNGYLARFSSQGETIESIMAADAKIYDAALYQLTGLQSDHGCTEATVDAYQLFDHCQDDWAAYKAYYEMLARHMVGQELNPRLRDHLLYLVSDYRRLGKTNDVISGEGLNRLFTQLWHGRLTPEMRLACNEILDYAHSALMRQYVLEFKRTGRLPDMGADRDTLAAYSSDAGDANGGAIESGTGFPDCEDGNGVSDISAAAALAEQAGITLEQALQQLAKKKDIPYNASLEEKYGSHNVFLGKCGACGNSGKVGPCGPGFCNDCDSRDRVQRGYIAAQYYKRQSKKAVVATAKYGEKASISHKKPMPGRRIRSQMRLTVGGVREVMIDEETGMEVGA